jgi:hypothetical protein
MSFLRLIFIFLGLSFLGKSCSLSQFEYCKFGSINKCEIKPVKTILHDANEKSHKFKRKYRVRGIQVFASTVSRLSFCHYHNYSVYSFPYFDLIYGSLKNKLHPLRGPPLA